MRPLLLCFLVASAAAHAAALPAFRHDIAAAEAQARKEKKPILYDFGAIWCPPCNELKETVFNTPTFLEKAKHFQLIEVDVDAKDSWAVKDRYRVGGYPTLVFTDPRGKEIYRVVGYRTAKELARVMDIVVASKDSNFKKACRSKSADDLWRCATVCAERKDRKCAERAFRKLEKKLPPTSPQYQDARAYFVENAPNADLKRDGYQRLIAEMPTSPRALLWSVEYLNLFEAGKQPAPKKELVEKVLANYAASTADPTREIMGISLTDMAQARADLLDKLGKSDEAKAAWKEAAQLLATEAAGLPAGTSARGFNLERIGCLEAAGELDAALALAQEYRAKYPKEFTFHYWVAAIQYRAKKYNDALPIAKQAYAVSYGDNRIRVATLLVKLYATVPDPQAARQIADEVKRELRPSKKLEVRTHRYLKKLDEAMAVLPKAAKS